MITKKIIIVIGQSASGKSTFIKNNFLTENHKDTSPEKYIKCCEDGKTLLFGHYRTGKRCVGCDTLSMGVLPHLINYIQKIIDKYETIIFDGDRISCPRFFDFIKSLGKDVDLYFFSCSFLDSLSRRQNSGSKTSEPFVRATVSKSQRQAIYGQNLGFRLISKKT